MSPSERDRDRRLTAAVAQAHRVIAGRDLDQGDEQLLAFLQRRWPTKVAEDQ